MKRVQLYCIATTGLWDSLEYLLYLPQTRATFGTAKKEIGLLDLHGFNFPKEFAEAKDLDDGLLRSLGKHATATLRIFISRF